MRYSECVDLGAGGVKPPCDRRAPSCYHAARMRRFLSLLAFAMTTLPFHACNPIDTGETGTDDDSGDADDDDTGDDDSEPDDDDSGPLDCTDDPFYEESAGLPTGSDPCEAPALVHLTDTVDGDTFEVEMPDGTTERVRLIGVDTPEYGDCYFWEASSFTEQQLTGDCFWLTFDADCRDPHDRLLAYAHTRDGFLQVDLLQDGFARTLAVEPNTTYATLFSTMQETAEDNGVGLWSACDD